MEDYIVGDIFYTYTSGMYPDVIKIRLLHREVSGGLLVLRFEKGYSIYERNLNNENLKTVFTTEKSAFIAARKHAEFQKSRYTQKLDALQRKIDKIDAHIWKKLTHIK